MASFLPYLFVGDACLKTETDFLDTVTHLSIPKKEVVVSQLGFVMTPSSCASRLPHWNMLGSSSLSSVISTARGLSLDIRPANVMVSLDGTRVYLTDFGFATKVGEMKKYEGACQLLPIEFWFSNTIVLTTTLGSPSLMNLSQLSRYPSSNYFLFDPFQHLYLS